MNLDEIFERAVSVAKTVWQKRGDEITRREVKRMIAAHGQPHTQLTVGDETDADS